MRDLYELVSSNISRCQQIIERHGWMSNGVADHPFWAYTVGMSSRALRELVVVGLSPESSHTVLDAVVRRHLMEEIVPGASVDTGFGYKLETRLVSAENMHLVSAVYGDRAYSTAIQIIWPEPGMASQDSEFVPVV